jgi:hypothetical protein
MMPKALTEIAEVEGIISPKCRNTDNRKHIAEEHTKHGNVDYTGTCFH